MSLTMSLPIHIPVMVNEAVKALQPQCGRLFVDCTVGLGGHAAAILEQISPQGRLLAIDVDPEAIKAAQSKFAAYGEAVILANDNFANLSFRRKK